MKKTPKLPLSSQIFVQGCRHNVGVLYFTWAFPWSATYMATLLNVSSPELSLVIQSWFSIPIVKTPKIFYSNSKNSKTTTSQIFVQGCRHNVGVLYFSGAFPIHAAFHPSS